MAEVDHKIRQIFNDSGCVYGSPRVTAELACRYQITLNRKTVAKRMRLMGLKEISPRMFAPVKPLDLKRTSSIPELVTRVFDAGELNRVWMSDITYLRTGEGWLYLCVVRDGHSRRVLGWAMDSVQNTDLVECVLRMAYTLRGFDNAMAESFWSTLKTEFLQPSTLRHPRLGTKGRGLVD